MIVADVHSLVKLIFKIRNPPCFFRTFFPNLKAGLHDIHNNVTL